MSNNDDVVVRGGGIPHDNHSNSNNNKKWQRGCAKRAKHRLQSIHRDTINLQSPIFAIIENNQNNEDNNLLLLPPSIKTWPWLDNKNCGSWYLRPPVISSVHNNVVPLSPSLVPDV
jgi:hypothetical protein